MIVGIISDIHGYLSDAATEALAPSDIILCAGDVERPAILMELEAIAPTVAVMGNCDRYAFAGSDVPFVATPRIGGVRFYMVHRPEDIGALPEDVRVVVHGHTHIPRNQEIEGVRYLNPGSASHPRGGSKRSVVRLTIEEGQVTDIQFISVEDF